MSGCNGNQNGFVLAAGGRSTSRVLAPPGGHSSISFGSCPPQQSLSQSLSQSQPPKSQSRNSSLPPKPLSLSRGTEKEREREKEKVGGSGGGRNTQGIGIGAMGHGDSLDRIMKPSPSLSPHVPGLESHYSKSERRQAFEPADNSHSHTNSSTLQRGAQRSMGRTEYAEELRRQIETKKELDAKSDRSQRRAYSGDFTNSSSSLISSTLQGGRHNGPQKTLAANEYAESLRAQIAHKNSLNGEGRKNVGYDDQSNPRNQVKSYSAPEPTRGRGNVPPGGHSTFSMKWD